MAFVGRTDVKDPGAQQDQWERLAWDTHMCASFMVDGIRLRQADEIGLDKVMWSSDYPYNESTFGYSERSLAAVVDAVGPENAVRIVGGNINRFLGI
jgi:predicted TIM-barrel fold metal-dependent hydrolase